jgi:hypothetical protein
VSENEDFERSPFVRVSFRKSEHGRAFGLAAYQLPTMGLPGAIVVVDIRRLRRIQAGGITEAFLGPNGDDDPKNKVIAINDLIVDLREAQKKLDSGEPL